TAVDTIADQISKMKVRLFSRRSGDEILSGDLYNLLRRPNSHQSTSALLEAIASWYCIEGEFALWAIADKGRQRPQMLVKPIKDHRPTFRQRRPRDGEPELEDRSLAGGARHVDRAAVGLGDVLDDREAQPGAAHFPAAGTIDA